jgi:hypothetical protein
MGIDDFVRGLKHLVVRSQRGRASTVGGVATCGQETSRLDC